MVIHVTLFERRWGSGNLDRCHSHSVMRFRSAAGSIPARRNVHFFCDLPRETRNSPTEKCFGAKDTMFPVCSASSWKVLCVDWKLRERRLERMNGSCAAQMDERTV
jgi:hypothetical protein